jgi:hypothetical protein
MHMHGDKLIKYKPVSVNLHYIIIFLQAFGSTL